MWRGSTSLPPSPTPCSSPHVQKTQSSLPHYWTETNFAIKSRLSLTTSLPLSGEVMYKSCDYHMTPKWLCNSLPSPSVQCSVPLEQALSLLHPSPLTPRGETQEKVKEGIWDMYFSENGRYICHPRTLQLLELALFSTLSPPFPSPPLHLLLPHSLSLFHPLLSPPSSPSPSPSLPLPPPGACLCTEHMIWWIWYKKVFPRSTEWKYG